MNDEIRRVATHSLETKVKSKKDLYILLSEHCEVSFLTLRLVLLARLSLLPDSLPQRASIWKERSKIKD